MIEQGEADKGFPMQNECEDFLPQEYFGGSDVRTIDVACADACLTNEVGVRHVAMLAVHSSPLASPGAKQAGGMSVYVRELARELGARDIRVDIYTCAGTNNEAQIVELDDRVRVITLGTDSRPPRGGALSPAQVPELVARIKGFAAAQQIIYDIIHSHYWLSGLAALELRRLWRVPVVHMFHTLGAIKNFVAPSPTWGETAVRLDAEERCLREADRIVAATPLDRLQMRTYYRTDKANAAVIIPCGVNTKIFRPYDQVGARAQLDFPAPPSKLILFVGRIEPLKGLDTLLRAMRLLHDARLIVVGGGASACDDRWGDEERRLHDLASELGVASRVEFLGAQPHERLPLYYSAADLLVAPSHYESFGLVALEAQACGTPVVASRVGGLTFTVRDGESGFLVAHNDAQSFADRIGELLADEDLRRRFGTHARREAQRFAWPRIADGIVDLYQQVRQESLFKQRARAV